VIGVVESPGPDRDAGAGAPAVRPPSFLDALIPVVTLVVLIG